MLVQMLVPHFVVSQSCRKASRKRSLSSLANKWMQRLVVVVRSCLKCGTKTQRLFLRTNAALNFKNRRDRVGMRWVVMVFLHFSPEDFIANANVEAEMRNDGNEMTGENDGNGRHQAARGALLDESQFRGVGRHTSNLYHSSNQDTSGDQ